MRPKIVSNRKTALILAADRGNLAIVKVLVEKGAGVNSKDFDGSTALMALRHEWVTQKW